MSLIMLVASFCWCWRNGRRSESYLQEEEARRKTRVAEIEATGQADATRIKATGEVLRILAELEPDQTERLQDRLECAAPRSGSACSRGLASPRP